MSTRIEKIEFIAQDTLKRLKVSDLPIPIEEIASKLGVKISRAPSSEFSGMLIRKDGRALIGISSNEAPVRQRFTIAHELGHFLLHRQKDAFVDYRDNKSAIMRTPREKQANAFAAALLMPKDQLVKDFRKFARNGFSDDELKLLAERYDVSVDSMRFRIMNLHLS